MNDFVKTEGSLVIYFTQNEKKYVYLLLLIKSIKKLEVLLNDCGDFPEEKDIFWRTIKCINSITSICAILTRKNKRIRYFVKTAECWNDKHRLIPKRRKKLMNNREKSGASED